MTKFLALHSDEASLVLELREGALPIWRHLGARVELGTLPSLASLTAPASFSLDKHVPMSVLPGAELGWFGREMLKLRGESGAVIAFRPAECSAVQEENAILISSRDSGAGIEVQQRFTMLAGGAICASVTVQSVGDAPIILHDPASALFPLCGPWARVISWRGRHNNELNEQAEPMPAQGWLRESRRGISGHGGPPGFYLLQDGATYHQGLVMAAQLCWSGDGALSIAYDDEGFWTARLGQLGDQVLGAGESLKLPDVILALSNRGRNGAMAQMHHAVRNLLRWPEGKMRPRLVHLNSWEACYFDHDEGRILRLARAAKAIGAERFILDDGWFKGRGDDTAALGDWTADPVKYPNGLGPLVESVRAMGLEFGLWVEPEMVNPNSDLCRAHPNWALHEDDQDRPTARNQLVLNMALPEVQDYLFDALNRLLSDHSIAYLKWDQNRDHAPSGGLAQTLGTYALLARLRAAHPSVEIEGCAGGGGRSDAGLAPYIHRFWTSDNVDALSRIDMQRGFLAFLPPEIMGAHIGASPCHATSRAQPLAFRAAIACQGHLGVEMDPETLSEGEQASLAKWIAFYKEWRELLHGGAVILGEGAEVKWHAQGNGHDILLFVIRSAPMSTRRPQPLPLAFAANSKKWQVRLLELAELEGAHGPAQAPIFDALQNGVEFTGSWLAEHGVPLPVQRAESVAIFHMKAVS